MLPESGNNIVRPRVISYLFGTLYYTDVLHGTLPAATAAGGCKEGVVLDASERTNTGSAYSECAAP